MKLSILVPSIPDREVNHWNLDHPEVEILVFADNKKRTVGEKRQGLLDLAQGDYVMFLDDDDEVSDDFLETVLPHLEKWDAITFDHIAIINDKNYTISDSIFNVNEQLHDGTVRRFPLCHSIWKRSLAKKAKFPKKMYGEDLAWAKKIHPKSEHHINKVLHTYHYDDKHTATAKIKDKMNEDICIISFSSKGREDYNLQALRMIDSVQEYMKGVNFLIYSPDADKREHNGVEIKEGYPKDCPEHKDLPYGFKPYLFKEAYEMGYRKVIWMDSTVRLNRYPRKTLDHMETNGIAVWDNLGHPLKHYINNTAIEELEIEDLEGIKQIMACVIGFDLRHNHTNLVLDEWLELQDLFKDDDTKEQTTLGDLYKSHRHDQTILSWLLEKHQVGILPYGHLSYPHHITGEHEVEFLNSRG